MIYFGCIGGHHNDGHALYGPRLRRHRPGDWPFGRRGEKLDGGYAPGDFDALNGYVKQEQSAAKVTHVDGWTVLAMWDRTGDSRENSSSSFVTHGDHDFDAMCLLAAEHFEAIWERINAAAQVVQAS